MIVEKYKYLKEDDNMSSMRTDFNDSDLMSDDEIASLKAANNQNGAVLNNQNQVNGGSL